VARLQGFRRGARAWRRRHTGGCRDLTASLVSVQAAVAGGHMSTTTCGTGCAEVGKGQSAQGGKALAGGAGQSAWRSTASRRRTRVSRRGTGGGLGGGGGCAGTRGGKCKAERCETRVMRVGFIGTRRPEVWQAGGREGSRGGGGGARRAGGCEAEGFGYGPKPFRPWAES
jgi:hypothetical protein